jgi:hypothetical protein
MEAIQQWSEGTRSALVRTGLAGVTALVLILAFGVYVYFFPTPLSEGFVAATAATTVAAASTKKHVTWANGV